MPKKTYEEARIGFLAEYDRQNPVTQIEAMKKWLDFLKQRKPLLSNKVEDLEQMINCSIIMGSESDRSKLQCQNLFGIQNSDLENAKYTGMPLHNNVRNRRTSQIIFKKTSKDQNLIKSKSTIFDFTDNKYKVASGFKEINELSMKHLNVFSGLGNYA